MVENCLRQELGYIVLMTAVSIKYRKSRCIGETYGKYKMCIFCVFRGKYIKTPEKRIQRRVSNNKLAKNMITLTK